MESRKKFVIARPIGEFENGPQKGDLTATRIRLLVKNQKKHPRQIPIFLDSMVPGDGHPASNDLVPPVGWVEGIEQDEDGNLVADSKLFGLGAKAVIGDLIRLASIFTVQGKNYKGDPIGEVLKHLLLSNESFIKDLNIAANQMKGEEVVAYFTTALNEEKQMSKGRKFSLAEHPGETEEEKTEREFFNSGKAHQNGNTSTE